MYTPTDLAQLFAIAGVVTLPATLTFVIGLEIVWRRAARKKQKDDDEKYGWKR